MTTRRPTETIHSERNRNGDGYDEFLTQPSLSFALGPL